MLMTVRTAVVFSIAATLPASALEFGEGLRTTGEFELEYFSGSEPNTIGYGKADLIYEPPGGGIGGFAGFDAVSTSEDSLIAFYGAFTYSGNFGKVQIGAPRAALDDYVDMPGLGGTRQIELITDTVGNSVLSTAYLFSDGAETQTGLRYDGTVGQAAIGASLHNFADTTFIDLAVNYNMGTTVLRAGLEHIVDGENDVSVLHLGANATFNQFETGFMVTTATESATGNLFEIFGKFSPNDKLDLTVTAASVSVDALSSTAFGIAADYNFTPNAYVQAGAVGGADLDSGYDLSVGVKF